MEQLNVKKFHQNWIIKIIDVFITTGLHMFNIVLFFYYFKKNNLHKFIHLRITYKYLNWI